MTWSMVSDAMSSPARMTPDSLPVPPVNERIAVLPRSPPARSTPDSAPLPPVTFPSVADEMLSPAKTRPLRSPAPPTMLPEIATLPIFPVEVVTAPEPSPAPPPMLPPRTVRLLIPVSAEIEPAPSPEAPPASMPDSPRIACSVIFPIEPLLDTMRPLFSPLPAKRLNCSITSPMPPVPTSWPEPSPALPRMSPRIVTEPIFPSAWIRPEPWLLPPKIPSLGKVPTVTLPMLLSTTNEPAFTTARFAVTLSFPPIKSLPKLPGSVLPLITLPFSMVKMTSFTSVFTTTEPTAPRIVLVRSPPVACVVVPSSPSEFTTSDFIAVAFCAVPASMRPKSPSMSTVPSVRPFSADCAAFT